MSYIVIVVGLIQALLVANAAGDFQIARHAIDGSKTNNERFLQACKRYQDTDMTAELEIEGYGLPTHHMYVTSLVTFTSTNPSVASVEGSDLRGNSVGYAEVSIENAGATLVIPDNVEVTDAPTVAQSLSVAAITAVEANVPDNLLGAGDTVSPSFGVRQKIQRENDTAKVSVYVNFDDGHYMDISNDAQLFSLRTEFETWSNDVGPLVTLTTDLPYFDGYPLFAVYRTCDDRNVTGLGRIVVSPEETGAPSAAPTVSVPSEPVITFVTLIHPEFSHVVGGGFGDAGGRTTHNYPTILGPSQWSVPYGLLVGHQPGSTGSIDVSVGSRVVGSQSISSTLYPVHSINNIVKQTTIYSDQRLLASTYQVRDEFGHAQTKVTGFSVYMVLNNTKTRATMVYACLSPDVNSGISSCSGIVPLDWFSPNEDVAVWTVLKTSIPGVTSAAQYVTLVRMPVYLTPPPLHIGMMAQLPISPRTPGNEVSCQVTASTGIHALTSWTITVRFDPDVLTFESLTTGSLYVDAVFVHSPGAVFMSSSSPKAGVTEAQVTGQAIDIGEIVFTVNPSAIIGTHSDCVSLFVNDMINVFSLAFLQNKDGWVRDYRKHGNYTKGEVLVDHTKYVGLLAYTAHNELVDTGSITGDRLFAPIIVKGVSNEVSVLSVDDLTSTSTCNVVDGDHAPLAVDSGCVVSVVHGCSIGDVNSLVEVRNAFGAHLNTSVPFRVWCAAHLVVHVRDTILNQIRVPTLNISTTIRA